LGLTLNLLPELADKNDDNYDDDDDADDVQDVVAVSRRDAVCGGKCLCRESDASVQDGIVDTVASRLRLQRLHERQRHHRRYGQNTRRPTAQR